MTITGYDYIVFHFKFKESLISSTVFNKSLIIQVFCTFVYTTMRK